MSMRRVGKASDFQIPGEPPLGIGDVVYLNSGGPALLVVDVNGENLTSAWRDNHGNIQEMELASVCFHRARNIW